MIGANDVTASVKFYDAALGALGVKNLGPAGDWVLYGKDKPAFIVACPGNGEVDYCMWTYITEELPVLIGTSFPADMDRQSIMGHSMGGHGALTIAFRHPDRFRAVSAFSPIVASSQLPWGQKALGGYLGPDRAAWRGHDAVLSSKMALGLSSLIRATPISFWRTN